MGKFETQLFFPSKKPETLPQTPEKGLELKSTKELSAESLAIV